MGNITDKQLQSNSQGKQTNNIFAFCQAICKSNDTNQSPASQFPQESENKKQRTAQEIQRRNKNIKDKKRTSQQKQYNQSTAKATSDSQGLCTDEKWQEKNQKNNQINNKLLAIPENDPLLRKEQSDSLRFSNLSLPQTSSVQKMSNTTLIKNNKQHAFNNKQQSPVQIEINMKKKKRVDYNQSNPQIIRSQQKEIKEAKDQLGDKQRNDKRTSNQNPKNRKYRDLRIDIDNLNSQDKNDNELISLQNVSALVTKRQSQK